MGDSIDLISIIKELEDMEVKLRKKGEYRMANMLIIAISFLNKYRKKLQEERKSEIDCDKER